ncbi:MAG: hypothetical protein ACI3XJ_12540 [Oscillospiraceae bacterium]
MSLESGQRLSLEELKQRNTQSATPQQEAEQAPLPEAHPTAEEWDELLNILSALYRLTAEQNDHMERMGSRPIIYATKEQAAELLKELAAIRMLAEQAGRKNGRHIYLPYISGKDILLGLLGLTVLVTVLAVLWYSWAALWNVVKGILL